MTTPIPAPVVDLSFPHRWQAEILRARPLILPKRHFVYPRQAEEVERGALELLVRRSTDSLSCQGTTSVVPQRQQIEAKALDVADKGLHLIEIPEKRAAGAKEAAEKGLNWAEMPTRYTSGAEARCDSIALAARLKSCPVTKPGFSAASLAPDVCFSDASQLAEPFLATCALGFLDPGVPTGLWSTPNPNELCAVSGGYAYLIDTSNPERFTMIDFRPVLEVRPVTEVGLLLFVSHRSLLAWGRGGQAWQAEKLSSEGVAIASIDGSVLHGIGWDFLTARELPFSLDLRTGLRIP